MEDSHNFSISLSQDLRGNSEVEVDEMENLLTCSQNYVDQTFCPQFGANANAREIEVDELENALSCSQSYAEQARFPQLGANAHVEDDTADYSGLELPSKNVNESCSVNGSLGVLDSGSVGVSEKKVVGGLLAGAMKKFAVPRSSSYHGVTKLKWSGKFEAHLWDNSSQVEGRKRKGKHVYLGSYDNEEKAARAHDLAALKYWGPGFAKLNFPVSDYDKELKMMQTMSQDEFVAHVRRKSSCFSRGSSVYRGVTRKDGKWQARIGRVGDLKDAKDIYLGTYNSEEEAAAAFDIAAIELRGVHAVTNFDLSNYSDGGVKAIGDSFQV